MGYFDGIWCIVQDFWAETLTLLAHNAHKQHSKKKKTMQYTKKKTSKYCDKNKIVVVKYGICTYANNPFSALATCSIFGLIRNLSTTQPAEVNAEHTHTHANLKN